MTFEKWWSDHKYHIGLTSMVDCKAAYLAGQASAEQRECKELEELVDRQQGFLSYWKAKCAELTRERDEAVRQWERFERMAGDNWAALKAQAGEYIRRWNIEPDGDDLLICDGNHDKHEKCEYIRYTPASTVKAQAGEPVGYHFSYTTPFGHVVWDIDYTPRPDAIECYPLVRAHPTTERPYNPLNDYAVISMNPTEPVKAQAGEPVAWMNKRGDVISAEEKTLIIENGKLGYPGGEFDLHAKNIERSYTIPLGVINV